MRYLPMTDDLYAEYLRTIGTRKPTPQADFELPDGHKMASRLRRHPKTGALQEFAPWLWADVFA